MNDLVPADELHWDKESNSYGILSREQTDGLIEACLVAGVDNPSDIFKVIREYEMVRGGILLFEQFLSGRLGICGFDKLGSPIFEPKNSDSEAQVEFVSFVDADEAMAFGESFQECGRHVVSDKNEDRSELYRAVLNFCSKWEIDILGGENPELAGASNDDPAFIADLKRRGWVIEDVKCDKKKTVIKIRTSGHWFKTKY
jgi:hypothetical protein